MLPLILPCPPTRSYHSLDVLVISRMIIECLTKTREKTLFIFRRNASLAVLTIPAVGYFLTTSHRIKFHFVPLCYPMFTCNCCEIKIVHIPFELALLLLNQLHRHTV